MEIQVTQAIASRDVVLGANKPGGRPGGPGPGPEGKNGGWNPGGVCCVGSCIGSASARAAGVERRSGGLMGIGSITFAPGAGEHNESGIVFIWTAGADQPVAVLGLWAQLQGADAEGRNQ